MPAASAEADVTPMPQDALSRLNTYEQRQAEMDERLRKQQQMMIDMIATQATMSSMVEQLDDTAAQLRTQAQEQAHMHTGTQAHRHTGTGTIRTGDC